MLLKNAVVLNDKFQLEKLDIKISGEKIEDIGTVSYTHLDVYKRQGI